MPPSPPPPPRPLERPDASNSGARPRSAGIFGRLVPRSALTILAVAGIAYSILIDNPFRPGQESVLRQGIKEYEYLSNGGVEAQKLKAQAEVSLSAKALADAERAKIQSELEKGFVERTTTEFRDYASKYQGQSENDRTIMAVSAIEEVKGFGRLVDMSESDFNRISRLITTTAGPDGKISGDEISSLKRGISNLGLSPPVRMGLEATLEL